MERLFKLYRYLAQSKHTDPQNSYTVAYHALEAFLDTLSELEYWGEHVHDHGGFGWEEADRLTGRLTEGFKAALCVISGDAVKAIHAFTESHLALDDYGVLLQLIKQSKEEAEKAHQESENCLGDLDDYPF